MKILDVEKGSNLHRIKFPQKYALFIKDGNKNSPYPPQPSSMNNQFTTADGAALAMKDPRKAKFFGIPY